MPSCHLLTRFKSESTQFTATFAGSEWFVEKLEFIFPSVKMYIDQQKQIKLLSTAATTNINVLA